MKLLRNLFKKKHKKMLGTRHEGGGPGGLKGQIKVFDDLVYGFDLFWMGYSHINA